MGCIIELFFEFILEVTLELVLACYMKLMTLIVPNKTMTNRTKEKIKKVVTTVAALSLLFSFIGLLISLCPTPPIKTIGKTMMFVSLAIIGLQILLGIVVRIVHAIKKK